MGLYHAMALDCGSTTLGTTCTKIEYGNTLDIMGNPSSGNFDVFGKERLGWVNAGVSPPYTTVTSDGSYWIETYESLNRNSKGLKILKSTDPTTGKKTYYYVEFRQAIDSDSFLSTNTNVTHGVVVATGSESSANSNYLLDMTPETSSWSDPALVVGKAFTDPDAVVTLQPLSVGSAGATVLVTFGPAPCIRGLPGLSVVPSGTQWLTPGASAYFTVTVTNTDSASCSGSTFALAATLPGGWTAVFDSPSLTLASGQSGSTVLIVTSAVGASDGYYTVKVAATNTADALFKTEVAIQEAILASKLDVKVSTNKDVYRPASEWVNMTAKVRVGQDPVKDAKVTFTIQIAGSVVWSRSAITDATGTATTRYKFGPRAVLGNYTLIAVATIDSVSGDNATSFTLR